MLVCKFHETVRVKSFFRPTFYIRELTVLYFNIALKKAVLAISFS